MRGATAIIICAAVCALEAASAFTVGPLSVHRSRRIPSDYSVQQQQQQRTLPHRTRTVSEDPLCASPEGSGGDVDVASGTEASHDASNDRSNVGTMSAEEEEAFLARTKTLCEERNLPLAKVKNARDLSSISHSPVKPNAVFRMGRVSDATEQDLNLLMDELGLKTLVDLRSPTELKDDPTLDRSDVFGNFTSVVWIEKGLGKDGLVRELPPGEPRIKERKVRGTRVRDAVDGLRRGVSAATHPFRGVDNSAAEIVVRVSSMEEARDLEESGLEDNLGDEDAEAYEDRCDLCGDVPDVDECLNRKERHFVSLMNEFKYVRGTLSKLRKRDIAGVLLRSPTAIVSKKARDRVKETFLDEINDGGLPLLNEFLLRFGGPGIKYVLELCADENRHPIAFYCTAGKDRTGMIAAIILSLLGVPDEDIVEDYSLSANVYAEMNDHKAMVGALSQRNLDPKTFLGAPPEVMRDTLLALRENYGDVEGYLDFIGFGPEKREKLKKALTSTGEE